LIRRAVRDVVKVHEERIGVGPPGVAAAKRLAKSMTRRLDRQPKLLPKRRERVQWVANGYHVLRSSLIYVLDQRRGGVMQFDQQATWR
jgi:hypothetical protein